MTIVVLKYDGRTIVNQDVKSFDFRTNHVSNWIKLEFKNGKIKRIKDVCAIKNISYEENNL